MKLSRILAAAFPPFAVGAIVAVASEITAGLLLYSGLGFLQALSVILAVEMSALALGLWSVSSIPEAAFVESLRRRWLFLLLAFAAAAFFSAGWEILGGLSAERSTQALGMALLGGLPLFAGGAVLGLLMRDEARLRTSLDGGLPTPESFAAFGAGAGFLATGFLILKNLTPTSILLGCVILISAAALAHGGLLSRRAHAERMTEPAVVPPDGEPSGGVDGAVASERGAPSATVDADGDAASAGGDPESGS